MKRNKLIFYTAVMTAIVVALVASAAFGAPKEEYEKMPGYVDFSQLGLNGLEARVEVFLKGPLLKMAREAVKSDEPELAGALDGVKLVRVNVFPMDDIDAKDLEAKTKKLASALEKKGWEMAVRVREEDQNVYIYLLPTENELIDGLVVMVVDADDEAVFVNIVGRIDPEQIGRIGRSIHFNGLDMYDWEGYYEQKAREEKAKDADKKSRTNRR